MDIKYGTYAPITHDLQAQFDARRAGMALNNVTLTTPPMVAKLNATVQNYSNPTAHADYSVTLEWCELRRVMNDPTFPTGDDPDQRHRRLHQPAEPAAAGFRQHERRREQPRAAGSNPQTSRLRFAISQLITRSPTATLKLRDLRAKLLGGEVTGQATVRDLSGKETGTRGPRSAQHLVGGCEVAGEFGFAQADCTARCCEWQR